MERLNHDFIVLNMNTHKTPGWFSIIAQLTPWAAICFFSYTAFYNPDLMALYLSKDHIAGGGLIENLTVIVLLPGIAAGLYTFIKSRSVIQPGWTAYWLLLWTLACIYFAGEEVSWGQWYFQWETPDRISEINDQNETNFHNMSTWLDQKPRTLVELWIFLAGMAYPLFRLLFNKQLTGWKQWFFPVKAMVSSGMFYTLVRFAGWSDDLEFAEMVGSSELREFCVALFLSLFLISYTARIKRVPA